MHLSLQYLKNTTEQLYSNTLTILTNKHYLHMVYHRFNRLHSTQ